MGQLNDREQRIFAKVRDVAAEDERLSIAKMAQRTGTSAAALVRISKKLGYQGWSDMYAHLRHRHASASQVELAARENVGMLCDAIERHAGGVILVTGIGDGEYPARFLTDRLNALGLFALEFKAETAEAHARLGRDGVAIIFNESGIALYNRVAIARAAGFESVAVTGRDASPLALAADVSVHVRCNKTQIRAYEPDFFCARALVLVELVAAECARRGL